MLYAIYLNLDQSIILYFGKGLIWKHNKGKGF